MRQGAMQATFADLEYGAKKRKMRCEKFLERYALGEGLKAVIDGHLESRGLSLREGTEVDASIVAGRRRRRTATASGIRRCARRKRGGSGTSG